MDGAREHGSIWRLRLHGGEREHVASDRLTGPCFEAMAMARSDDRCQKRVSSDRRLECSNTVRSAKEKQDKTRLWGALRRHFIDGGSVLSPSVCNLLYPTTGSASNLIIARYRNPFEKSNISFLGPGTFFVPGLSAIWSGSPDCHQCLHSTPSLPPYHHVADLPPTAHPPERAHTHRP